MTRATAPPAPGRLGEAIPAASLLTYLDSLTDWRADRRKELDRLDAAALRSPTAEAYTADLTLAMTMWQSVSDRLEQLTRTWDDGRVDARVREELSRLIWGTAAGAGLSLVESCRLSDALTASLRAQLSFDPAAADIAARIADTRASLERCAELLRDRKAVRPQLVPDVDALRRKLAELASRAARGADVTGPFAELEGTVARAERDLIVAGSSHAGLAADYRAAIARRRDLEAREAALRELVSRVGRAVTPVPRLAVPDVERLGRVPQQRAELSTYSTRLETVAAALAFAEKAYSAALAERDELRGLLAAFAAKVAATGRTSAGLQAAHDRARTLLWSLPCPLPEARAAVNDYRALLNAPLPQSLPAAPPVPLADSPAIPPATGGQP